MAQQKRKLGRGLNSLLSSTRLQEIGEEPENPQLSSKESLVNQSITTPEVTIDDKVTTGNINNNDTILKNSILELTLNRININPHQPRQLWDENKLNGLSESIKANGVIQPIIVRKMGDGYQLIAGERRLRATELAGLKTIPAVIKDATEEQVVEWALVENIHRADLNAIERAKAYYHYINEFSLTQQEAALRLGENRSTIANYMRLMDLPSDLQEMVNQNILSMGHARCLLSINDKVDQIQLATKAAREGWSVRTLERQAKLINEPKKEVEVVDEKPHITELALNMTRSVGSKVSIKESKGKGHKGKVIIEYYSLDDFDKIKDRLI